MQIREQKLLEQIEAFLEITNMSAGEFGMGAVNDAKLIPQLRQGRELRFATREKVVTFMHKTRDDLSARAADAGAVAAAAASSEEAA